MIRVVVVDDHTMVRAGLERLLTAAAGIEVVGTAGDGPSGVDEVGRVAPDVVLMDLSMPGGGGVQATARLTETHPSVKVVILTAHAEHDIVHDALRAGAIGYLLKDSDPDDVVEAVRAAARGEAPLDPRAAMVLLPGRTPSPEARLTEREAEVLSLVTSGLANKQIARRLGISEKTVKAHLTRVFATIGVSDRTQAAIWAMARRPQASLSPVLASMSVGPGAR